MPLLPGPSFLLRSCAVPGLLGPVRTGYALKRDAGGQTQCTRTCNCCLLRVACHKSKPTPRIPFRSFYNRSVTLPLGLPKPTLTFGDPNPYPIPRPRAHTLVTGTPRAPRQSPCGCFTTRPCSSTSPTLGTPLTPLVLLSPQPPQPPLALQLTPVSLFVV